MSLQDKLKISDERLAEVNALLLDPNNALVGELLALVEKYGGPEAINQKAKKKQSRGFRICHCPPLAKNMPMAWFVA